MADVMSGGLPTQTHILWSGSDADPYGQYSQLSDDAQFQQAGLMLMVVVILISIGILKIFFI